ncbi:MAG TPA: hypothetical protein VGC01_12440 [Mucilaginibacter sp.]
MKSTKKIILATVIVLTTGALTIATATKDSSNKTLKVAKLSVSASRNILATAD